MSHVRARDVLAELREQGLHVEVHGDRLRYRPASLMSEELAVRVREVKAELLHELREQEAETDAFTAEVLGVFGGEVLGEHEGPHWESAVPLPPGDGRSPNPAERLVGGTPRPSTRRASRVASHTASLFEEQKS